MLLAAGSATRVKNLLGNTPKAMVQFYGRPFLDLLLAKLITGGCRDIVIVGNSRQPSIESYISSLNISGVSVLLTQQIGSGTAAALRSGVAATSEEVSPTILCINADTVLDFDISAVLDFHYRREACATAIVTTLPDAPNRGAVTVEPDSGKILCFNEGDDAGQMLSDNRPTFSNCGYWFFDRSRLTQMNCYRNASSLELEVLPVVVRGYPTFAYNNASKYFLDFGTPLRLLRAWKEASQIIDIYPIKSPMRGDYNANSTRDPSPP